jgi:hypothetical protein
MVLTKYLLSFYSMKYKTIQVLIVQWLHLYFCRAWGMDSNRYLVKELAYLFKKNLPIERFYHKIHRTCL